MSCGEPHETDCSEVLDHLYEYLDREMPEGDSAKYEEHFEECSPCLEKYGLEQEVKKLVKRCCGHDDVPADLRSKVMNRIEVIRAGQSGAAEEQEHEQAPARQEAAGVQQPTTPQQAPPPGAAPSPAEDTTKLA